MYKVGIYRVVHTIHRSAVVEPDRDRETAVGHKNRAKKAKSSKVFGFALFRARGSRFLLKLNRDRVRDLDRGNN